MAARKYRLRVAASAERALARLPEAAAAAIVEFMLGELLEKPTVVGKPLRAGLAGTWVARRGPYRVIFAINTQDRTLDVMLIDHRADVYRPR